MFVISSITLKLVFNVTIILCSLQKFLPTLESLHYSLEMEGFLFLHVKSKNLKNQVNLG